jgi:hypothetical protein
LGRPYSRSSLTPPSNSPSRRVRWWVFGLEARSGVRRARLPTTASGVRPRLTSFSTIACRRSRVVCRGSVYVLGARRVGACRVTRCVRRTQSSGSRVPLIGVTVTTPPASPHRHRQPVGCDQHHVANILAASAGCRRRGVASGRPQPTWPVSPTLP